MSTPPEPDPAATPAPLLDPEAALAAAAAVEIPEALARPHVMRLALGNPRVARVLASVVDMAVLQGTLDARLREIAILRVAWRIGSVYEWSNHVPIARRAGMSDDEVLAVRTGDPSVLTEADRVAIAVADEVLDGGAVSPATLAEARAALPDEATALELVAIPGCYRWIASLLATYSVPLEDHLESWAPDGRGPAA